jgi:nitrogen-specific signal transduction histidine kinase
VTSPRDEPNERSLGERVSRERQIAETIRVMHDDELVDFIRDTIVRLDSLADRLEVFTSQEARDE